MKSRQLGLITAIAVIMWTCNANKVTRSANLLSLDEHSTGKGKFDLLSFQRNSTTVQHEDPTNKQKKKIIRPKSQQLTSTEVKEQPELSSYQDEPPLTLESLYKELDAPVQTYQIDPNKDNSITCMQGTEIFIPKGSFELKNNEDENAVVSINVKEYYGTSALLFGNLGTVSGDQLIESGGTIYMDAFQNNQAISLKKEKRLNLKFPDKDNKQKDGMELFTGNRNQTNQQINWRQGGIGGFISSNNAVNPYRADANPKKDFEAFNKILKKKYILPKNESFKRFKKDVTFKITINPKGKLVSIVTDSALRSSVNDAIMPLLLQLDKWAIRQSNYWFSKKKIKNTDTLTEYITLKFRNRRVRVDRNDLYDNAKTDKKSWSLDLDDVIEMNSLKNTSVMKDSTSNATMNYAFSTNTLGWINCDRFLKENQPLTNVVAKSDDPGHSDFKLVFKDINAIMPGYINGDEFSFPNIPVGHRATLLAIKINDHKIYVTTQTVVAGTPVGKLSFKEVTKDELKTMIKQLGT